MLRALVLALSFCNEVSTKSGAIQFSTALHIRAIIELSANPITPDGRYLVVKGRLWRCSDPSLDDQTPQWLVNERMDAKRAVKAAKPSGDPSEMKQARADVHAAKVALGDERGPVWWTDGAPDLNQSKIQSTTDASWYQGLEST